MKASRGFLAACVALLPASGFAQTPPTPAERVDAAFAASGELLGVPPSIVIRNAPPSSVTQTVLAEGSLILPAVWDSLQPPHPAIQAWLAGRIPGLDTAKVRTLTQAQADAILDETIARGKAGLDLFTDFGLRGDKLYYLPQDLLAHIFSTYEMRIITPASGKTTDGQPFVMQGLVMGGGKLELLYSFDDFHYKTPYFPDFEYIANARVTETIAGAGDLRIEGIKVDKGLIHPKIQRFVRISPTEVRVETNYGNRTKPLLPMHRLAP